MCSLRCSSIYKILCYYCFTVLKRMQSGVQDFQQLMRLRYRKQMTQTNCWFSTHCAVICIYALHAYADLIKQWTALHRLYMGNEARVDGFPEIKQREKTTSRASLSVHKTKMDLEPIRLVYTYGSVFAPDTMHRSIDKFICKLQEISLTKGFLTLT